MEDLYRSGCQLLAALPPDKPPAYPPSDTESGPDMGGATGMLDPYVSFILRIFS